MIENITIGQLMTVCGSLVAIWVMVEKIIKPIKDFNHKIDRMDKKIDELSKDNKMISDITYQMLDHMSTNNNTGGMKKVLDKYNAYFREN